MRASTQDLILFYNLPAFTEGDVSAFLSALARACGLVKKVRSLDLLDTGRY
jgi:nuclear GTP-binding protein